MSKWTLFSNHGHVLVCLARDPEARLRDVAAAVGITERAVQKIVRDLQQGDMISVSKQGRRNQYRIHKKAELRHELEAGSTIGGLVDFVTGKRKPLAVTKQPVTEKPKVAAKPEESRLAVVRKAAQRPAKKASPIADELTKKKSTESVDKAPLVKKKKVAKKAKTKSDIEKQQGSLF